MTSDGTATGLPATGEWDDDTLALLKYGPPAVTEPETTSELVLVPGYTQSEWDRHQVHQLNLAHQAETYLWDNLHKTSEVLVRDLLLLLGRPRAAAAHMAGAEVDRNTQVYVHPGSGLPPVHVVLEGAVRYADVPPAPEPPPAAKPKPRQRPRPSRARKTVTGGT